MRSLLSVEDTTLRGRGEKTHSTYGHPLISLLICPTTTRAQSGWYLQNPLPTAMDLSAVCFTDANTGTAVGESGTILRTTDGGTTWTSQSNGTTVRLNGVCFTDANTGTAVGRERETFSARPMAVHVDGPVERDNELLVAVCFTDANTGTVVGSSGTILRTTNGGATWAIQSKRDNEKSQWSLLH